MTSVGSLDQASASSTHADSHEVPPLSIGSALSLPPFEKSLLFYRDSDLEYLVSKLDGSKLSQEEYIFDMARPIFDFRNSRDDGSKNFETFLKDKGLRLQPIPKTVYDLFYLAFRIDKVRQALKKEGEEGCDSLSVNGEFIAESAVRLALKKKGINLKLIKDAFIPVTIELNQYVLDRLKLKNLEGKEINEENILNLIEELWPTVSMQNMEEDLREAICLLAEGKCPINKEERHNHCHEKTVFQTLKSFEGEIQLLALFKKAACLEHSQKSSYYTLEGSPSPLLSSNRSEQRVDKQEKNLRVDIEKPKEVKDPHREKKLIFVVACCIGSLAYAFSQMKFILDELIDARDTW